MQHLGRAASSLVWGFLFLALCARVAEEAGLVGDHRPVVQILQANSLNGQGATLSYVLFDPEDRSGTQNLRCGLYYHPDRDLASAKAVRVFAHRIVEQQDLSDPAGGNGLAQGRSVADVQRYTWSAAGLDRRGHGLVSALAPGEYYLYLVADDGVNDPVFAVSDSAIRIEPAPAVLASGAAEQQFAYLP